MNTTRTFTLRTTKATKMAVLLTMICSCVLSCTADCCHAESPKFKGVVKTDIRDSKPDWVPFTPKKAPANAPNILFVLYDDTGMAACKTGLKAELSCTPQPELDDCSQSIHREFELLPDLHGSPLNFRC
jgi:hypothetical protein